jgi:hypothetical protein
MAFHLVRPGAAAAVADDAGDHFRRLAVHHLAQPTPAAPGVGGRRRPAGARCPRKTTAGTTPGWTPPGSRRTPLSWRPSARCPSTPWISWPGRNEPPPSAPGGNYPATTIPPTRSDPNPPRPPRTSGPSGTRPWPLSARPTAPKCTACPTAGCCTCATPTPSKQPGPPGTSAKNCARFALPPGTPAWPACAPPPKLVSRAARRPRPRRGPVQAGRRLPGPGAGLPAARDRLRADDG